MVSALKGLDQIGLDLRLNFILAQQLTKLYYLDKLKTSLNYGFTLLIWEYHNTYFENLWELNVKYCEGNLPENKCQCFFPLPFITAFFKEDSALKYMDVIGYKSLYKWKQLLLRIIRKMALIYSYQSHKWMHIFVHFQGQHLVIGHWKIGWLFPVW